MSGTPRPPRPIRRPSLLSGSRALALAEIAGFLASLAVLPHLTRSLGVPSYGRLQFVAALGAFASFVADPGLGRVAVRRTARAPDRVQRIAGRLQPLRFATACLAGLGLSTVAILLRWSPELRNLILLQSGIILAQSLGAEPYLTGLGRLEWIGYARSVSVLLYAVGVFFFVRGIDDAPIVLACSLAASIAVTGASHLRLRSSHGPCRWSPERRSARIILRESVGYGLSSMMSCIYARVDVLMLRVLKGEAAVGLYSAAVRITEAVYSCVSVAVNTAFPRAVAESRTSRVRAAILARRALRTSMLFAVPTAVGAAVAGGPILAWVAGPGFAGADVLVALLGAVAVPATAAIVVSTFGLGVYGRSRALLVATTVGAAVNAGLNLLLLPRLGLEGAAVTTILAQAAVVFVGLRAAEGSVVLGLRRTTLPWLLPSALMGLGVLLVRVLVTTHGGALLAVGALLFPLTLLATRATTTREREGLGRLLFPWRGRRAPAKPL